MTKGLDISIAAIRERIATAAKALSIDPDEIDKLNAMSDAKLDNIDLLADFARRHNVNLDWLAMGKADKLLELYRAILLMADKRESNPRDRADHHMREFTKAMRELSEEKGAVLWILQAYERMDDGDSDTSCRLTIEHPTPPTKEGGREGWIKKEDIKVELSVA